MSLPLDALNEIPVDTVRVARASFPKGSLAMQLRDHLGPSMTTHHFCRTLLPPWCTRDCAMASRLSLAASIR